MPGNRSQHIVHLVIRHRSVCEDQFLFQPQPSWTSLDGLPYITLPSKRSVLDPLAERQEGESIDGFVEEICRELGIGDEEYVIEQELPIVSVTMPSPIHGIQTDYLVFPISVWVSPHGIEAATSKGAVLLGLQEALASPRLAPSSRDILKKIEAKTDGFVLLEEQPTMNGLAMKWLAKNRGGVRHLPKETLSEILDRGNRAFNLRVADPYLRYQMQGLGFTWSFFTHKDKQDTHVHGAPVVEIYGVLEGAMEIWWKPYYDRGTSAWCHRVLRAGDWLEVDSLQCHVVHWRGPGKGVVFKAGPGPLAGVGRLGEKGKTPCSECACMKPPAVLALEGAISGQCESSR